MIEDFLIIHLSVDEYYLLLEWNTIQHQFYSYLLFLMWALKKQFVHIDR